jgi:MerR family copper efflux transcriptional regulator
MGMMTVGKAAAEVGVSRKTIRLWEAKGLVQEAARTPAGYRLFTDTDLTRLQFIQQAKSLGFTLSEIGEILFLQGVGETPCGRVAQVIAQRINEVDRMISDLRQLRHTLTAARKRAEGACPDRTASLVCPIIEQQGENP